MAQVPSNLIPVAVTQLPQAPVASEDSLLMVVYNGNNYKIRAGDLLQVAGVPISRQVLAGTGLTGGGALSSNVTLSVASKAIDGPLLADTGVTPGTYGSGTAIPVFTVDSTGRVTAVSSLPVSVSGYVPTSTQIIAGVGLTGGGTLNGNVTLNADLSNATPLDNNNAGSAGVSTQSARADHQHPAVDLSDDDEIDGILGLNNGGTARSLVMNPGAIIWSGADGLYVGPPGVAGQVLISGGTSAPSWGTALIATPQPAHYVFVGPTAGPDALPTYRLLVNDDLPNILTNKVLDNCAITGGSVAGATIDDSAIGAITPSTGIFTQVDVDNLQLNNNTLSSTNVDGDIIIAPNGNGAVHLDADNVRFGDIDADATLTSNGAGNLILNTNGGLNSGSITIQQGVNGNVTIDPNGTGEVVIPAGIDSPLYIDFNTAQTPLPAAATGRLFYNNEDQFQTFSFQMNSGITQHVGEEQYFRVKCSSAVTKGQVVMFTGTLGASGGLTVAPATGLTPEQSNYILGVATESGNTNDWIFVTSFGEVKSINTTGGAENWVQGQVLYYNPSVTGGLTKNKPVSPNAIAVMAAVVHVGTSNGILFVRPTFGSVLGGTDGNVQFGTLNNGDVIVYDSTDQRWENVAQSTLSVGTATNATNVAITNDTTTNAAMYPVWVTGDTGNLPPKVTSSKLSFNPATGILTATGGIAGGSF